MAGLRAGVIGVGMMGSNHVRVLQGLDGIDLVGVTDPAGDVHGAARGVLVLPDVDTLIAQGLDLCVVAVPTDNHRQVALALASAGVHTLIEKPLAADSASAAELVQAFDSHGLVGCVGHIERYNPALLALRARLDAGELGEVYQVATRRQGPFPNRIADVGVVKDLATHDLDLTTWVTRRSYRTVAAQTVHKSGREHEDLVAVVACLDDGVVANHLVNWLSPMKERLTVVTGNKGCFVADTLAAELTFFKNGTVAPSWDAIARFRGVSEGDMTRFAIPKQEPLRSELEAFRDAVLGLPADVVTLEQGMAAVLVAEACIEAARTGRSVTVGFGTARSSPVTVSSGAGSPAL